MEVIEPTKTKLWINKQTLPKIITISMLTIFGLLMLIPTEPSTTQKILLFGVVSFVLAGHTIIPPGPIQGPLSFLWKSITGLCLFYFLCLLFLLFHTRKETLQLISTYVDPKLSFVDYNQISYGEDCTLSKSSLYHSCFDFFALAHFLGWFSKTLICRDVKLLMFSSITFELIEYSLRNTLNNFKECWWDHMIIDFMGCNLLGIICGFYVIDLFKMDRYRWSLRTAPLQLSHWKNFIKIIKKWDLSQLQTKAFSTLKHFIKLVFFIILFQINDLSTFFLKYVWNIPADHYLSIGRVTIVGLICVNGAKQYYDYMKGKTNYLKINIGLMMAINFVQFLIIITHGQNSFEHAYIDSLGIFFLGMLCFGVVLMLVKVAISDILRAVRLIKGNIAENKRIVEKMEYAKLVRQL